MPFAEGLLGACTAFQRLSAKIWEGGGEVSEVVNYSRILGRGGCEILSGVYG